MSIQTVMVSVGVWGKSTRRTVPLCTPPTRTSAPDSRPTTLVKRVFNRYVGVNRYCLPPMMKIAETRMVSAAMMKAPRRAALDILAPYEIPFEEFPDESVLAVREFLEGAAQRHLSVLQQHQAVRHGLRTPKVVRDDDRCQVVFPL